MKSLDSRNSLNRRKIRKNFQNTDVKPDITSKRRFLSYTGLLLILSFVLCLCTSCSARPDNSYVFDGNAFENAFVGGSSVVKAKAFTSDLCLVTDNSEINATEVDALAYGLFPVSGTEVISVKNAYEKVYPASTTKILTCLIALENSKPDDIVTIPDSSDIKEKGSSMAGLRPGDRIRMEDLLYGLMVPSGNDAAAAIAEHISGSAEAFSRKMNERAMLAGATKSHFVNPHGLHDENHYTTLYDLYLIFHQAIKNKTFRKIASTAEYSASVTGADGLKRNVSWKSSNGFLTGRFSMPEDTVITAGKTGHTSAAGFCLVLSENDTGTDEEYISIIMKSEIQEKLYSGMQRLISKRNEDAQEGSVQEDG